MEPGFRVAVLAGGFLLQRADSAQALQPEVTLPQTRGQDPLETVGIALLAYGLVQLLAKVIDKLPAWRGGGDSGPGPPAGGNGNAFSTEDRKRLERVYEQAVADRQRLERLEDSVREQMAVQQRLVGQVLDEIRELHRKLDDILRKLRALWTRVGRRKRDRG